jgi:ATP-dependent helicase HrpB
MALPRALRALDLPVEAALAPLLAALARDGGSAVLVAEPGGGKTTLVGPALLDTPWCAGRVIITQPRRLATRAAAQRLASLLGEPVGHTIGWRMRGDTKISRATRIEFVTDGVLTRMAQSDPSLEGVDAVVLDEFHERSLDADVGLALCLDVRHALRPDLRIVAMSATIDGAAVATVLGDGAAVITAPGRTFPVDTVWLGAMARTFDPRAVVDACGRALRETGRDVLVFLPGAGEIRAVQRALEGIDARVTPLHGTLSVVEQDRAITPSPPGHRKIVLATSIAETSITIEGIDAVVDAGWTRRAHFDPQRGMSGLVTTSVSRAAADQRQGRAGRSAAGRANRLWSEAEHAQLAAAPEPEIRDADLAPLALDLIRWGDPDGTTLRWVDPPPRPRLAAARALLADLGLIQAAGGPDGRPRLSEHGRRAAVLPVHPRLAHALIRATDLGHGSLACDVVAVLSDTSHERETDLHDRVVRVQRRDGAIAARRRTQADRLRRELRVARADGAGAAAENDAIGLIVALAYPDRVAQRRGTTARYRLASGAGAELDALDPLVTSPFLAIAELDIRPGGADARVQSAAPLGERELELVAGPRIREQAIVEWDRRTHDVRAETVRHLGAIVLSARPLDDGTARAEALLDGVRSEGLGLLDRLPEADEWRARVAFCRRVFGAPWPDLSDATLLDTIGQWLAPRLVGLRRRSDLARIDPRAALRGLVPGHLIARLDQLAPTQLELPSGRRRPIDYAGEEPVLAARLQEVFGWQATPRVADGRVPVVLQLLSPADRPVQVTKDLDGFWRGSYAQVRAELRGRYPKHDWPADPATATARRGTRRRPDR